MTWFARRVFVVALIGGMTLGLSDSAPARQSKTALQVNKIKYVELGNLVRSQKGKIVVVDFWASNCAPCMREFPRLVQLHNTYKGNGFLAMAVAVDDPQDAVKAAKIVAFLEKQKAAELTTLHLDEKWDTWTQKLGVDGPPCVYVFNREGRVAGKWPDAADRVDYTEIERLVAELMKK